MTEPSREEPPPFYDPMSREPPIGDPWPGIATPLVLVFAIAGLIAEAFSVRAFIVAGLRLAFAGLAFALATLLPDLLAWITRMIGHTFLVIAIIGLAAPAESAVTGSIADTLLEKLR